MSNRANLRTTFLPVNCTTLRVMGETPRMLSRLGAETQVHHAEADADVDRFLFRPTVTVADYRQFLARAYGFAVPLEAALVGATGLDVVIDVKARMKSPHLRHDLLALGMTTEDIAMVPLCRSIPVLRGPAAALGWLYVIERPMLASAVIRRHLATRLPDQMIAASRYLACYAGQVGSMWRELGEALDKAAYTTQIADRIVAATHEAFRALHVWRLQGSERPTTLRIAG